MPWAEDNTAKSWVRADASAALFPSRQLCYQSSIPVPCGSWWARIAVLRVKKWEYRVDWQARVVRAFIKSPWRSYSHHVSSRKDQDERRAAPPPLLRALDRGGKLSILRVVVSSCQNSPHAVNRSLR